MGQEGKGNQVENLKRVEPCKTQKYYVKSFFPIF